MRNNKTLIHAFFVAAFCSCFSSSAYSIDEPNANYSSLILSYRSLVFANPVCVGNECRTGLSGPALVFSHQVIPNLAFGLSGSYAESNGRSSALKSSGSSVFLEAIAGMGSFVDVGVIVAALHSTMQVCLLNPTTCISTDDTGTDAGVFGMLFLDESKSTSVTLSYDSISYKKSTHQSIVGVSLVTILAEHHRLALFANKARDSGVKQLSAGYGFGYSYLF
ncbi:MAG: hypothetical protein FD173_182 [Gallionellaceae bacterium]|nr:MAG: hypothetical protein FD173_182 [Gallionellaceae bacterium]